nr:metal ABC transporter ATP-binding protein [Nocardia donostiensis]
MSDSTALPADKGAGRGYPARATATQGNGPNVPVADTPAVRLADARLSFGDRTLWNGLDLQVEPGEFIAILGPNGSGKTSLLRVLLGQLALTAGSAEIAGMPARTGHPAIGYIPQQKTIDAGVQLRGTDLVGLGVDGHRWGLGLLGRAERKRKVAAAIADVGAQAFANAPLESMSGGEQQRLRVAQALVGDPGVLLCDEPLLSLDLANQRLVSELIDRRRREHGTAVLFVTHEINPVLPLVDRVLYLVDGKFRIGTPDEVMTSAVLSELYQTEVDVLRVRGRLVVVGTGDTMDALGAAGAHCHGEPGTPHIAPVIGHDRHRANGDGHVTDAGELDLRESTHPDDERARL